MCVVTAGASDPGQKVTGDSRCLGRRRTKLVPENPGRVDLGETGCPWEMVPGPEQAQAGEQAGLSSSGLAAAAEGQKAGWCLPCPQCAGGWGARPSRGTPVPTRMGVGAAPPATAAVLCSACRSGHHRECDVRLFCPSAWDGSGRSPLGIWLQGCFWGCQAEGRAKATATRRRSAWTGQSASGSLLLCSWLQGVWSCVVPGSSG